MGHLGNYGIRLKLIDFKDNDAFEEDPPFTVSPGKFKLPAGETKLITVTFSPKDAGDYRYKLVPNVPYLHSSLRPIVIGNYKRLPSNSLDLIGSSVRPLCHFELEESDYLSGGRRNPGICKNFRLNFQK